MRKRRKEHLNGLKEPESENAKMWSQFRKRERGWKRKPVQANSLQMQRVEIDLSDQNMNNLK